MKRFKTAQACTAEGFCTSFTPTETIEAKLRRTGRRGERLGRGHHRGGRLGPQQGARVQLQTRILSGSAAQKAQAKDSSKGIARHRRTNASGEMYVSDPAAIASRSSPLRRLPRQFGSAGSRQRPAGRPERDRDRRKRRRMGAGHRQLPRPGVLRRRGTARSPFGHPGHRRRPARAGLRPGLLLREPVCL